jgi:ankyrin repeat protein
MSTEFRRCVFSGNLERVKQLVEGGANITESDANGTTALLLACKQGHFEIVVYLLEHSANIAQTDRYCISALHCDSEIPSGARCKDHRKM